MEYGSFGCRFYMFSDKKLLQDNFSALVLIVLIAIAMLSKGFSGLCQLSVYALSVTYLFCDGCIVRRYFFNKKIVYQLLILLLFLVLLFFANSSVIYNSYIGFYYFLNLIIVYIISVSIRQHKAWNIIYSGIGFLTLVNISFTLYQLLFKGYTPHGFFESQNSNGAFINVVAISSLLFVVTPRKFDAEHLKIIAIGFYGLCCMTILLIGSRGVIIAHLAILICVGIFLYRTNQYRLIARPLTIILCAYLISGILNQWQVNDRFDDLMQSYINAEETFESRTGRSIHERFNIWQSTLEMWSDTSVIGSGYSSFHMRYPAYRNDQDRSSSGQYVHNDYLQVLLELGYPGLCLMVIALLIFLIKLTQSLFLVNSITRASLEKVLLLLAVSSVFIHSIVSYNLYVMPVMILVCMCMGRYSVLLYEDKDVLSDTTDKVSAIVPTAIVLVLLTPLGAMLTMHYYHRQAYLAYEDGKLALSEKNILQAERWFATENIHLFKSLLYLETAGIISDSNVDDYYQWALQETDKAEKLNPYTSNVYYYRGLVYKQMRHYKKALQAFNLAIEKNRRHYMARLEIAKIAEEANNLPLARKILEEGIQFTLPRERDLKIYLAKLIDYRQVMGDVDGAVRLEKRLERLESLLK